MSSLAFRTHSTTWKSEIRKCSNNSMIKICQLALQDFGEEQRQATTNVPPVPKRGSVDGSAASAGAVGLPGDFARMLDAHHRRARRQVRSAIT